MLLFLARNFVSHAGITNNGSEQTDSVRFCRFGSNAPRQNGCMGADRVIDLKQFPVRISTDKAPTPLTTLGILFSPVFLLLLSLSFLSFCLSLYSHVRFMAFQSLLVGTTPAFTIIINHKRSLLGPYIGIH